MQSKNSNKLVNVTKKKKIQIQRRNKLLVTSGKRGRGRGKIGVEEEEVFYTFIMYKISYKDVLYNTVFCSNSKWNTTFKDCEALYCTPVTCVVLYIAYTSMKKMYTPISRPLKETRQKRTELKREIDGSTTARGASIPPLIWREQSNRKQVRKQST